MVIALLGAVLLLQVTQMATALYLVRRIDAIHIEVGDGLVPEAEEVSHDDLKEFWC